MLKSIFTVLLLISSLSVYAEQSFKAPLVKESLLLDITGNDFAVVVGERGHVLIKQSAGEFEQVIVPTQTTLTAVTVIDDKIWAVGHDALILHSPDAGKSWEIQMNAPELDKPFLDVVFLNHNEGIAVGAYGLFFRTKNGGKSWDQELHGELVAPADREYLEEIRQEDEEFYQQELNFILPHINHVEQSDNGQLLMAGEAGLLAVSPDNGNTWQRLEIEYFGSFLDIKQLASGQYVAAGLRGNIFTSPDGENWSALSTCSQATLNAILPAKDSISFIGNNGMIIKADLPLSVQPFDPFRQPARCEPAKGVSVSQTESKAALLNAAKINDQVFVTATDGIYSLALDL